MKKFFLRKNSKRGATLVELCIVMALVTIIGVMVVSFSTLIGVQLKKNKTRVQFIQACDEFQADFENWFAEVDSNQVFKVNCVGKRTFNLNDTTLSVQLDNKVLLLEGNTHNLTETYNGIKEFKVQTNSKILQIEMYSEQGEVLRFIIFSRCGGTFEVSA